MVNISFLVIMYVVTFGCVGIGEGVIECSVFVVVVVLRSVPEVAAVLVRSSSSCLHSGLRRYTLTGQSQICSWGLYRVPGAQLAMLHPPALHL